MEVDRSMMMTLKCHHSRVYGVPCQEHITWINIMPDATLKTLKWRIAERKFTPPHRIRLWKEIDGVWYLMARELFSKTLGEIGLEDGDVLHSELADLKHHWRWRGPRLPIKRLDRLYSRDFHGQIKRNFNSVANHLLKTKAHAIIHTPHLVDTPQHLGLTDLWLYDANNLNRLGKVIQSCAKVFCTERFSRPGSVHGTNELFMMTICQKRDPVNDACFLCLEEGGGRGLKGVVCRCGCVEVVIFRPCGHSACLMPCFVDFCTSKGVSLKNEKTTNTTNEYTHGVTLDVSLMPAFGCPVCRQIVQSVFNVQDLHWDAFSEYMFGDNLITECERINKSQNMST